MSVKDKGISITLGLIFSILAGVGSYYTGKANAQTERAVMKIRIEHLEEKVIALEATEPEVVADRVKELKITVKEIQTGQKETNKLLREIKALFSNG